MIARIFILSALLLVSFQSAAAYYYLTNYNLPHLYPLPPCTGNWDISGNKYECGGSLTLQSGDEIIAYETSQLEIKNNIYFESNIIGSPSFSGVSVKSIDGHLRIIDTAIYGAAEAKQSIVINEFANGSHNSNHYSFILGKVISSDSSIRMINTDVRGDVVAKQSVNINVRSNGSFAASRASIIEGKIKSHDSSIRVVDVQIEGDVDAKQSININTLNNGSYVHNSHVSIGGKVKSSDSSIRILNANITDDVDAKLSVNINVLSNGTYATNTSSAVGGEVVSRDQSIRLVKTNVADNIKAKQAININRLSNGTDVSSTLSNIAGDIESTENNIVLGAATHVVGDVTAGPRDRGKVFVKSGSTVDGTCLYQTVPENACSSGITFPDPVALYHLDEASWNGNSSEVVDSSGNRHHGTAFNGPNTASTTPALPTISSLGTCGYGVFDNNANQFIEIADHNDLDIESYLTISAWVYPTSRPNTGLHSIISKDNNYEVHIDHDGKVFWWWEERQGRDTFRSLTSQASLPLNAWSFITIRYSEKQGSHSEATMFINSREVARYTGKKKRKLTMNNKPLQIGQDQNYPGRAFDGYIDEVQIFDKYLSDKQIKSLYEQRHRCSDRPSLQCFTDDFNSTNLSDLWVTSRSKGTFTPDIVNSRLRFTEPSRWQSTAASYQRLLPAANNLVEIEFDHYAYGGSGADGIAIVLSDATVTPNPGAYGGPLGYGFRAGVPGFAGGWLGIGIDEYGNFSNQGGEGNKPGRRRQSVALRGSGIDQTGYKYLAGACNNGTINSWGSCLDPKVDNNNNGDTHRYKIIVDSRNRGESNVEIFRKLGNGDWSSIVGPINVLDSQYNQSDIPQDFLLSITGSTGASTNIHEVDNFQVCALDSRPIKQQIDHFRLTHSGQELTCNAESVLIEACLDADCSSRYTDSVTTHLAPATLNDGGWVGGNVVTFSGGSASFDIRKKQIGSITLGVTGSSPTIKPFAKTLCSKAGSGFSASHCGLQFTSNGFDLAVSDKIANLPTIATLQAGGRCGPGFANESKSIAFWSTYESPTASNIVGAPKVKIADREIGNTESTATPINVQFDANGEAQLQLDYPDAGKLQLNAKYTGQPSAGDQGLVVEGDGEFVSFPQRLVISAKNSANQAGACANANLNCSTFAKAGEQFDIEVKAMSGSNSTRGAIPTPNYSDNVGFEHLLVAPNGKEIGELVLYDSSDKPITNPGSVLLSPGETKAVPASISEVGVFSIKVTPPSTYLGSNYHTIPAALSANIGRFYPAYFSVVDSSSVPNLDAFCSSDNDPGLKFSYIGQNFTYEQVPELYLEPKSVKGTLTNNYYHKEWWRYSTSWTGRNYKDFNGRSIVFEGNGGTTAESASGRVYLSDTERLRYVKSEPPVEPFEADFSLVLTASDLMDSDNVCVKTSDSNSSSDCLSYSFSDIDQDMELRWGRLLIHDTYGPEVSSTRQRIEVQHLEKGRFETNVDDSCTDLVSINRFDFISDDYTVVVSGVPNPPEVKASLQDAQDTQVEKGVSWIDFSAPGAGDIGLIETELDLNKHGLSWLNPDLSGAGTVSGIAQFGIYRGSDRVIWWSEPN